MAEREALWGKRLIEWSILAFVILAFVGVFSGYAYRIRGQAERAAVITTLGALRTALVVDHLRQAVSPSALSTKQESNPFAMLERLPVNYAGRLSGLQLVEMAPGQWAFDAVCDCVGYKPTHTDWLDGPDNAQMLWFQVTKGDNGVYGLRAVQPYRWQEQTID